MSKAEVVHWNSSVYNVCAGKSSGFREGKKMVKYIEINPVNPQQRLIGMAVDVLKKGGVICYPTDTMYGIGCDIFNQKAVKRVHEIRQRPQHKPFSFMCASLTDISQYAHVSSPAYRLLRKHLPGPYTMVLPGSKLVPKIMLTKQKTVGIRLPQSPICLALIEQLGNPVLNTSALREDREAPVDGFAVEELFGSMVDLIIDGGEVCPEPSTVISLVEELPEILREGKGDITPFMEKQA
jgi:tRNA threonylcarbamoyl adenosine modification protein (Sua5/YciO/YrdC/YwlC family)